ncbi:phthiotriol/phenolphthiotriol dimycocerosates methyltransferase [Mycobacterium syngnathidarum]
MTCNPLVWKLSARHTYPRQTRRLRGHDVTFLNVGYEEDPPLRIPLEADDEPNRAAIQLYHRTATQIDITGKRVLEVGCGHGGGARYLARTLNPVSYTGIDLNAEGIAFCCHTNIAPEVNFAVGDAQDLPFPDNSFEVVVNIESSHCYPDFPGFLREVDRVLMPGGHFLYADLRSRRQVAQWEAQLGGSPLTMRSMSVINPQVIIGLEKRWNSPGTEEKFRRLVAAPLRPLVRSTTGAPGSALYHALQNETMSYRLYSLVKDPIAEPPVQDSIRTGSSE